MLILDEAGMVGSADMAALLSEVTRAGAKLVLIGDPEQLQPIAAGGAFRALVQQAGTFELDTVYRQNDDWARAATVQFQRGLLSEAMIGKLVTQQGHDKADNPAILEAVALFAPECCAETLEKIVASNTVDALGSCGASLATALQGPFANKPALLFGAAQALAGHLPGDPASAPKDQWGRSRGSKPDATFVADMAGVVDRVDAGLASRTAAPILAWPRHFELDRVLVLRGAARRARNATARDDAQMRMQSRR